MIRGKASGYEAIPDENLDEPIEFYTQNIKQMNNLLKTGTKVSVTIKDRPRVDALVEKMSGEEGIIVSVDTEELRTVFPYYVETKNGQGWVKENEVTAIPADNAPGFLTVCVVLVIGFYGLLAACNAPHQAKTQDTIINPIDTLHSRIPYPIDTTK